MTGVITKPDFDGYGGVILGDNGISYYLHQSECDGNRAKYRKGNRVRFDPMDNGREMLRAMNVKKLGRDKFTISIVLDIESREPYPVQIIEKFICQVNATLKKYNDILRKNDGKLETMVNYGREIRQKGNEDDTADN